MSTPVMQPAQAPSAPAGRTGETSGRQHWSLDDFELGPKLGEGRFGKIYLARERRTHAAVALKCIAKEAVTRTGLVDQLRAEIELQHRAGRESRHVVRLFAYFWDETTIFLALEYAEGGDLRAALDAAGGRMHESDAAVCIGDVASGLAYLHRSGLAHRDLKPENILLRKGRCKIADFTWVADCASERRTTVCGTLDYLAPEVVRSEEYNGAAVDLWCLGILAFELLAGKPPFERPQSAETCRAILEGHIEFLPGVSDAAADLIVNLLRVDPRERLPASTVLHHPWIQAHRPSAASSSRTRVTPSPFLASLRRYRGRSSVSQAPASQDHRVHTSSVARSTEPVQRNPAAGANAALRQQPAEVSVRQSVEVSRALDMSGGAASDVGVSGVVVSTAAPSHVGSAEAPPSADTTAKLESSAPSDVGQRHSMMHPPESDSDATPDESSVDDGPPDVSAITLGEA
jgi:aurora kinase C